MQIHKRILSLIICAALLLCCLPVNTAAASDFPSVLAEAKKGVVQIYGLGGSGRTLTSWIGTGFAVGKQGKDSDIFLTNWHVVTGSGDYSLDKARIWILQENCEIDERTLEPDPAQSITCEVLKTTTGYPDYAVIRATESVKGYKPLPLLSSKDVPDGLTVYALGYPGVVGYASASHYGIDDITSTNGIISQHMQFAAEGNTWVLMHTAQISGGNSGGPLITEEGAVVGLNTYGFGENEANMNRYCAVYIDYAMEGLDALDLPYELYTDSASDEGDEQNPTFWIAVCSGAVLAAAAALVMAIKQKKKHEAEAKQIEEERRKEAEQQRLEEARRQEDTRHRKAQEIKAQLQLNGGALYSIRAAGCVIGRDHDCSIRLPENTPGVSHHHCKLLFRDDQLFLLDTNSTYGTYIYGKRIPANTPVVLKSGSSFCLGSEACRFTVHQ